MRKLFPRKLKILAVAGLAFTSGILYGCDQTKQAAAPPRALIRVDARTITLDQFREEFKKTLQPNQTLSKQEQSELQRTFLVRLIDRELVLAEADRLQATVTPEEIEAAFNQYHQDYPAGAFEEMLQEKRLTLEQWRRELEESLLMEKVVRRAVFSRLQVEEPEIQAYYDEHREEFDRPEQVRARQLVVATEEEGQRILGLLRQGQKFEELARRHSLSPDAEQGGDLGFFARGEMPPEFDEVVFSLPVGRLSDLVKSEYGYHLFLVEEHRQAKHLPLDEARETIRRSVMAAKEEAAYQDWLRELRSQARIEVDWSQL